MKKRVHIVPHTHWDREWYFTAEESRILLVNNMEEILEMLENNTNYPHYVLDGQTAILEDYFAAKPENKDRIKRLVQSGKLIIGPWYTQTDEVVVGGESIVRNLLYGIKDCEQLGGHMKIGYLPDSFGQSAQLPQILNGFDINHSIFWRGTSERHGTDKTEFYWESNDGSRVLVQLFPLGYAIGKYLPTDETQLKKRMDKYFKILDKGATTEHIIIPNGHDQMPIQKNIFNIIEKLKKLYPDREFFLSRYENVLRELDKAKNLDSIKGEFLDGKYMRVHRSIYSTRADIKSANTRIENKITNVLEPLATLAYNLGFEYYSGLMELIWKKIMKNHAHDSIACCCSDKVHKEIFSRFNIAEEKVEQLSEFYKRKIVEAMPNDISLDKLVVFNLLPYDREEVIEAEVVTGMNNFKLFKGNNESIDFQVIKREIIDPGLIDRQIVHYGDYEPFIKYTLQFKDVIPAMGYKTYFIKERESMLEVSFEGEDINEIETDYYKIYINKNGTLNIFDKRLNRSFNNVFRIEDSGDDGDEYDYSPLLNDLILYNDDVEANYSIKKSKYFVYVNIDYKLDVPKNIESRKKKIRDGFIHVKMKLSIPMDKALIDIKINIVNEAKDHRVRLHIPTGLNSKFSITDNQFGSIKRPVIDPAIDVWGKEKWQERPDPIYPMLSYVGLSNEDYGVAVFTNSTREYEIVGENYDTIAITLFRSVGYLGKEELVRRPGRPSGIRLETPDSQMLGNIYFHYGLVTHEKSTLEANVPKMAKEFLTPLQFYNKMPYNAMKLNEVDFKVPYNYSFVIEDYKNVILSTIKKWERGEGIIVRLYNPKNCETISSLSFNRNVKEAYKTNLNEKKIDILGMDCNQIKLKFNKNEIQTILLIP